MKKRISLSIPTPCSEKWDNFTTTPTGGFCGTCSKNVIDLTRMSDADLLRFLKNKPAHTCGRFRPDQLKEYSLTTPSTVHPGLNLLKAGLLSLLMVVLNKSGFTQNMTVSHPTEIVQVQDQFNDESGFTNTDHIIKGIVRSQEDNEPLPGVNIYLKDGNIGTTSDADGAFEFPKKLKEGDVLYFSYVGFETIEYTVPKEAVEVIEISMAFSYMEIMGKMAIDDIYTPQSGISKWWDKVKRKF